MEQKLRYLMSINVVAYLRANGHEIVGTPKKTEDGKLKFWFEDTEELKDLLGKYNKDEFLQLFIGKLRQTKNEMRAFR